jgi:hypothetical protein
VSRGKGTRTLQIVAAAERILDEIQPATIRAVCYRLFVAKLIPDMTKVSTNAVSRMLARAREEGEIPWDWIVDESRRAETVPTWSEPNAIIRAAINGYRKNYWQDQDVHVEVWSEKGTVRGTLGPILDEYGVTFRVMHGYASATVINDIAEISNTIGKPFVALYVGDWDPSGKHMSDIDLPRRLDEYGAAVDLQRVALIRNDLADLLSFDSETKRQDTRYRFFQRHVGTKCYELDALPPPDLRSGVEAVIRNYIDLARWDHARMVEAAEVQSMEAFHKSWQASICSRQP